MSDEGLDPQDEREDGPFDESTSEDAQAWRALAPARSLNELCDELLQVTRRAFSGVGPAAPQILVTLSSGTQFTGVLWSKSQGGHLVVEGIEGIHTIALGAVAAITLPLAPVSQEVLTDGRVEAPFDVVPSLESLLKQAQVSSENYGIVFKLADDLRKDQATLIGMERLLGDVAHVVMTIQGHRTDIPLQAAIDEVWLGRGGRAGAFVSGRRIEVRARLEDGRQGRMERDELLRAIEAVL